MNIYLVRHGTTAWNKAHKIQGRSDIPLDELGVLMARQSGEELQRRNIFFDTVFTSPLQRALKTAQLLVPYREPVTDPRLIELSFGIFEGRTTFELMEDPNCPFTNFKKDPVKYNREAEGLAETLDDLMERTSDFLTKTIAPLARKIPSDHNIMICGHGAMNRALLMHFRGDNDLTDFWGKGLQDNCGINIISCEVKDGNVSYTTQDICNIFYDPSLRDQIGRLL